MSEDAYIAGELTRHLQQQDTAAAASQDDDALASLFAPRSAASGHPPERPEAGPPTSKKRRLQEPEPPPPDAPDAERLLKKQLQLSAVEDEGRVGVKARAKLAKLREKARESDPRNGRTVFVGNVSAEAKKRELLLLFRDHGPIESARFRSAAPADAGIVKRLAVIHKKLSRPSLNAYIVYKERESVAKATAALNGHCLRGLHLRVDGLGGGGGGGKPKDNKKCIFLGNLQFKCDEESVRSLFSQCGRIDNVRLVRDARSGIGRGFGFVQFADSASVELALRLAGADIGGRAVRVTRCSDHPGAAAAKDASRGSGVARSPQAAAESDTAARARPKKWQRRQQQPQQPDGRTSSSAKASGARAPRPTNRTFAQAFQRTADKRKAASSAKKRKV